MERGQQQVGIKSKTPAAKHEMYRLPGYMAQQKTHPKSATAMLMRGINASIPQSPLGIERQRMEQILVVDDKYRSLNPQKEK
jgi:hypothetical protein